MIRSIGEQVEQIESKTLEMKAASKQLEDRLGTLQATLASYLAKAQEAPNEQR